MKLWNTERAQELKRLLRLGARRYVAEPVDQEAETTLKTDPADDTFQPE